MSTISLRAATAEDEPFLFDLYGQVRAVEFAALPLPPEQKAHLIRMQYSAQHNAYESEYPGSGYELVLLDGQPVGRVWIARLQTRIVLVDIALLESVRNRGIGKSLISQLQTEAIGSGKPIRSTVSRFNPGSLHFHQSLGFRLAGEDELHFTMEWIPYEVISKPPS
jgi:RimJ/RimL family protein N-acetyltransferase